MTIDAAERIRAALTAAAAGPLAQLAGVRPIAIGWATVELERAERELSAALALSVGDFSPAASSIALGAQCRIGSGVLADALALVLLEPQAEGRLAATLARLGEGPAVVWLVVDGCAATQRSSGVITSAARHGPLGPERLVLGGPVHGPHQLLVGERPGADVPSRDDGPAGTIQP